VSCKKSQELHLESKREIDTCSFGGKEVLKVSRVTEDLHPTRLEKINPAGPSNDYLDKDTYAWFRTADGYATVAASPDDKIKVISPPTTNLAKIWWHLAAGGAKELDVPLQDLVSRE
jgi:hypothetical protein